MAPNTYFGTLCEEAQAPVVPPAVDIPLVDVGVADAAAGDAVLQMLLLEM